jgi:hypothetical protein
MNSERRVVSVTPIVPIPEPVILQHRTEITNRISEQVSLQEVLGKEMYTTFHEVLKHMGASMGWIRDEINSDVFIKKLRFGIEILIDLAQDVPVVSLHVSKIADISRQIDVEQELAKLIEEVSPEYRLEMNKLLDVCYIERIKTAIEGSHWKETLNVFSPETQMHTVEIELTF